jgi:BSD domain
MTFCEDPDNQTAFAVFCKEHDADARGQQVAELMRDNAFLRELHTRLVPDIVDEELFWQRYFFRCAHFPHDALPCCSPPLYWSSNHLRRLNGCHIL